MSIPHHLNQEQRKHLGAFYTPRFIVQYIVQRTLGQMLANGAEPHALRILDPACGAGDFLIVAFDVLDDWLAQHGTSEDREFPQRRRLRILQENIYGVDLDEQAVEVARLNLLLRAAGKREKLPMLNNIKRGNSLINDLAVAGDAAFKWEDEFPEVFADGGFDVVIGNPPYVRQEWLSEAKDFFQNGYETYHGMADLYIYFMEKGHKLLKSSGRFGMIVSNKWMKAAYGKALRRFLAERVSVEEIVDLTGLPVFRDATVRTVILLSSPQPDQSETLLYTPPPPEEEFGRLNNGNGNGNGFSLADLVRNGSTVSFPAARLSSAGWSLARPEASRLIERLIQQLTPLVEYVGDRIYYGIKSGLNQAFIIDQATRDNLVRQDPKNAEIIKPVLMGRDVRRYSVQYADKFLIWTYIGVPISRYPAIRAHLEQYQEQLEKRWDKGDHWWELRPCDYYEAFEQPKIIYPDIAPECRFALDTDNHFLLNTGYIIPVEDVYLLGILNSKLGFLYFSEVCAALEGASESYLRFIRQYVSEFPVHRINHNDPADATRHDLMVERVRQMLDLKQQHAAAETTFDDRRHELAEKIKRLDKQIDALVYELYGLTDEEIAIVEGRAS